MYVIPSNDIVVVVYAIAFDNAVEQAIAKVFLQEIVISRRQSRDLMTAPSVTYSQEPPLTSDAGMGSCVATTADTSGASGAYAVHGHEYVVLAGASDKCARGEETVTIKKINIKVSSPERQFYYLHLLTKNKNSIKN